MQVVFLRSPKRASSWPAAFIDEKIKHLILSSFADGIRMMKKILSIFDVVKLQQYLNEVYFWTEKNNAQLNGDQFEHVSFEN